MSAYPFRHDIVKKIRVSLKVSFNFFSNFSKQSIKDVSNEERKGLKRVKILSKFTDE